MAALTKDEVVNRARAVAEAEPRIRLMILFGSRARERARPDSDADFAIDAPGVDSLVLSAALSRALRMEVDVVPLGDANIPMLEELVVHGVLVHASPKTEYADWRSRTLVQLETDRPNYHRMRDAWLARVARDGLGNGQ